DGRVAVAVAKGLMKPGEVIEIKTPNAVTAIRGTVVIAEVQPVSGGHQSAITILRGLVDVTGVDSTGALRGPAVKVGALERVTVVGAQPVPAPQKITRETAAGLAAEFSGVPKTPPTASAEALNDEVKLITMRASILLVGATSDSSMTVTSGTGGLATVVDGVTSTTTSTLSTLTSGATNTLSSVTGGATGTLGTVTGGAHRAATGPAAPAAPDAAPGVSR